MKIEFCVKESMCKSCGYCVVTCPKKILEMAAHTNESGFHPVKITKKDLCTGCALCYQVCPEIAIEITRER